MPGKLYYKGQQIITPTLGGGNALAMYLGVDSVGYDGRYSTFISASGGTIFDSGSFRYHLFTSSADLTIYSTTLSQVYNSIEVLVVGAGAGATNLGGAGAGAVVHIPSNANFTLDTGTYNVIIGSGGASSTNGNPSFISSSAIEIEALGGITDGGTFVSQSSLSGVSGQYGHNEPNGFNQFGWKNRAGGGGAGEPGGDGNDTCTVTGNGGDGYEVPNFPFNTNKDTATTAFWGGGGGGGRIQGASGCPPDPAGANGGNGGGARGIQDSLAPFGINGMPNSGGGGGMGSPFISSPGTGGSGFVGIRYQFQP
jgi:hypothetical protein